MYKLTEVPSSINLHIKEIAKAFKTKDTAAVQRAYDILTYACVKNNILIYTDFNVGRVIDSFEVREPIGNGYPTVWTKTHFECLEELENTDMYVIEYKTILDAMEN